jgi:hypothetical protein
MYQYEDVPARQLQPGDWWQDKRNPRFAKTFEVIEASPVMTEDGYDTGETHVRSKRAFGESYWTVKYFMRSDRVRKVIRPTIEQEGQSVA